MYNILIDVKKEFAMLDSVTPGQDAKPVSGFDRVELGMSTGIFFFDADKAVMLMIPWQNVNTVEFKSIL